MTKILKSRYALYKNFEEDLTGQFLFKIKRREITRKLFSYANVLHKIKPLRLSDLLIRRKKQIRGIFSRDLFRFRKIKHFYGFSNGRTKIFNKVSYSLLHKCRYNRLSNSISFLEARLDVMLVRLQLFVSIIESRNFIKNNGVFVNNSLVKNYNYKIKTGSFLSFSEKDRVLLKRKLYVLAKARPVLRFNSTLLTNCILRETSAVLTTYSWLFRRCIKISPFFFFGFPRYVEVNLNSMDFYFYGNIKQFDLSYPFKTSIFERTNFFTHLI